MSGPLKGDERASALAELEGWSETADRDAISKSFKFRNFNAAFAWMTQVALTAEKMDHHPEWFNVYSTVKVQLATHDVSGISYKDFDLAEKMDELSIGI